MVMDIHKVVCDAVESFREKAIAVSRSIHSRPEFKFAERFIPARKRLIFPANPGGYTPTGRLNFAM